MPRKARKQLSLKQAEASLKSNADSYKRYVAAQLERKEAKSAKSKSAAQKVMDDLRSGYTAYRNAYRDFLAQGGTRRNAKPKPAKSSGGKGGGKGSRRASAVKTTKLSKAAMARRTSDNPNGLTDTQLAQPRGDDESAAVTPGSEVVRQG